ncbi:MAG: hypothetical protein QOE33_2728 [Acidobacteriota bacterium]|nr:hypothetical protein [Acidobacteriota bacterium]
MRRKLTIALFATTLALFASVARARAAFEGRPEYDAVVRLVESHYHVKHIGIPFLANAGVKTAKIASSTVRHYSRFADLKLAVFDDQDFAGGDHAAFHAAMQRLMQPVWTPLAVVRVRDEGQTYTYTREDKGNFKVIVCVIGERDATVLEVGLNEQEFLKLLSDPEQETKNITDSATNQRDDN